MACSAIGFAAFTFIKPIHERSHGCAHPSCSSPLPISAEPCADLLLSDTDCTTMIVTIAATAYYSMAAWGGSAPITSYTTPVTRPMYWCVAIGSFMTGTVYV